MRGAVECARLLLEAFADIDAVDRFGNTVLHRAASGGSAPMVALLLDSGADLSARDTAGATPLHMAAGGGRLDTTRALLEAGADVSLTTFSGSTPLHWAVLDGRKDCAALLLSYGASVRVRNNQGTNVKELAVVTQMKSIVDDAQRDEEAIEARNAAAAAWESKAEERAAIKAVAREQAETRRLAATLTRNEGAAAADVKAELDALEPEFKPSSRTAPWSGGSMARPWPRHPGTVSPAEYTWEGLRRTEILSIGAAGTAADAAAASGSAAEVVSPRVALRRTSSTEHNV